MWIEPVTQIGGVTEKCRPWVGATPGLQPSRVGSAALVAPTPGPERSELRTESGLNWDLSRAGASTGFEPELNRNLYDLGCAGSRRGTTDEQIEN